MKKLKIDKSIFLILLVATLLSACTSKKGLVRNLDEYYTSSGVEQYFLSEVPNWINFSSESACFRDKTLRYFNIDALMKSFSLSYAESIQVQAIFNQEYLVLKDKIDSVLPVKEEEVLFYKSTESVSNKILFFDPPKFKKIHLIWLDEALASKEAEAKLKRFLNSSINDEGYPVFVTNCLTKPELTQRFPNIGVKFITSEMFSVYDVNGKRRPKAMINVSAFFSEKQELIFYMQDKAKKINQLEGNFKVQNY